MVLVRYNKGREYDTFVYGKIGQDTRDFTRRALEVIVKRYSELRVNGKEMTAVNLLAHLSQNNRGYSQIPSDTDTIKMRGKQISVDIGLGVAFYWRDVRSWSHILEILTSGRPYAHIRVNDTKVGEELKDSLVSSLS
ncbi:MAG: hypothetical protein HY361_03565 [Candidatus Aenigmarchaeota archaeon]|nr:hypothetical protein [Candidatus Aenigmarchaeota archaeon]